jgi:hypothetical protein
MGLNRRELLISAIAVATGFGFARTASARDAGMTMEQARKIIGDRHKTFDATGDERPLSTAQMRHLVTGNTIFGVRYDDEPYVLSFHSLGRCVLNMQNRPIEHGRWWVDEETEMIHSQWERPGPPKLVRKNYFHTGEPGLYRTATWFEQDLDGPEPPHKHGMFLLQEGLHLPPTP